MAYFVVYEVDAVIDEKYVEEVRGKGFRVDRIEGDPPEEVED
jgi:hypothetical protein